MLTGFGELPNFGERGLLGQGLGMNLCLLILNCRNLLSRVGRGIPSLEAAQLGLPPSPVEGFSFKEHFHSRT
jgi:hypothetical protein